MTHGGRRVELDLEYISLDRGESNIELLTVSDSGECPQSLEWQQSHTPGAYVGTQRHTSYYQLSLIYGLLPAIIRLYAYAIKLCNIIFPS